MTIEALVKNYEKNRAICLSSKYNETQLRSEFLDVFFELLGWDIKNSQGKSTFEREVILEEGLKSCNGDYVETKKPDYTFRLSHTRKFFVEAKKPSVMIENDKKTAQQVRRYGFTAKLCISVLSNFENLMIYDCSKKVEENDTVHTGLIKKYHYTEYVEKFDEIRSLLGKDAVYSGKFDLMWADIENQIEEYNIDNLFLDQINGWRLSLANVILKINKDISEENLNDCVQAYINSIIFLRVVEDRNIEQYHSLLQIKNTKNLNKLKEKFHEADVRYNSGLFKLPYIDKIMQNCGVEFWNIISDLYYPNNSYSYSVLSSDILGNIYEIFLLKKIKVTKQGIELVNKPEYEDRDVVTTPLFVIQKILDNTLVKKLTGDISQIVKLKIADIACGSGAFLLESYQYINDYLIDYYKKYDSSKIERISAYNYKLKFETKKTIMMNCLYGVDKDYNAVETTRFGLLLKLLENENLDSLPHSNGILPELRNIYFGNSLISPDDVNALDAATKKRINPFDFAELKFDIIIGNPPYMKTEDIKKYTPDEKKIYENKYVVAYKQYDKYFLFVQRTLELLTETGMAGYILPSKFMKVGAAQNLRELLSKGYVSQIISFGANQVFQDKTTYTCILCLTNQNNKNIYYTEVKNLKQWLLDKSTDTTGGNLIPYNKISKNTWIMYPNIYECIYDKIVKKSCPLEKLVGTKNIFNGIQTSRNDYFVFTSINENRSVLTFKKDNKIYKIERSIVRPYYETPQANALDALSTYRYFQANSYVIYPYYKDNDGSINFITIEKLEKQYPLAYKYITENKDKFVYSARGGKRDIKPEPETSNEWYRYGRHQSLEIGEIQDKIVVGILSKGNKYAIDNSKTLVSSGGTAGYCMIAISEETPYSIYYIQALLNSKMLEWYCSLIGEVFRGGYIARGTKVLQNLPIKCINFEDTSELELYNSIVQHQQKLIDIQKNIDKNSNNHRECELYKRNFSVEYRSLEANLKQLYNLSDKEYELIPNIGQMYEA